MYVAPALPPGNVRVENADTIGSVIVEWDPLSEEATNGVLQGYIVHYREENYYHYVHYYHYYEYLGKNVNTTSAETKVVLRNLDAGKTYEISVAAFTRYMGPRSEWQRIVVGK